MLHIVVRGIPVRRDRKVPDMHKGRGSISKDNPTTVFESHPNTQITHANAI